MITRLITRLTTLRTLRGSFLTRRVILFTTFLGIFLPRQRLTIRITLTTRLKFKLQLINTLVRQFSCENFFPKNGFLLIISKLIIGAKFLDRISMSANQAVILTTSGSQLLSTSNHTLRSINHIFGKFCEFQR